MPGCSGPFGSAVITVSPGCRSAVHSAELAVAAPYVGNFEPRLVFTCLWGLVGWALCATLGVMEILPYWLTVSVASIIVFCLYMPMHEATHDNIRGDAKQLAWVNEMVGWVCSIPLLLDYPSLSYRSSVR